VPTSKDDNRQPEVLPFLKGSNAFQTLSDREYKRFAHSFTMKRSRSRIATLGIFAVLGSGLIQTSVGDDATDDDGSQGDYEYPGTQYISQECAPRRRRARKVEVTEVDFFCDSQSDDDGSYTNSPRCKAGDLAKASVSCTLFYCVNRNGFRLQTV
jgi:hypothetical protein